MNPQRGEVALDIGGETRKLCLTLGALAEIEAALGCESLKDLSARLKRVSAKDLQLVLAALLRGGGETAVAEALPGMSVHPASAIAAVLACFRDASA